MNETKVFKRTISQPVNLTEEERLSLGQEIAGANVAYEEAEEAKKKAGAGFTATMKAMRLKMREKSRVLKQGYISREVPCETHYDYRLGVVRVVRLDTNETLGERPMTIDERQTTLPDVQDALMEQVIVGTTSKGVRAKKTSRAKLSVVRNEIVEDDIKPAVDEPSDPTFDPSAH